MTVLGELRSIALGVSWSEYFMMLRGTCNGVQCVCNLLTAAVSAITAACSVSVLTLSINYMSE